MLNGSPKGRSRTQIKCRSTIKVRWPRYHISSICSPSIHNVRFKSRNGRSRDGDSTMIGEDSKKIYIYI